MNTLRLPSLKGAQLKYLAFLTGVSSGRTKEAIGSALLQSLNVPPTNADRDGRAGRAGQRVVSIDMGIRNLAYCAVQAPFRRGVSDVSRPPPFKVMEWERMDLLDSSSLGGPGSAAAGDDGPTTEEPTGKPSKSKGESSKVIDKDAFTPPRLARTAHGLADKVLALDPDVILIERQRFRTSGALAVQEWTLRVNMFESMLWACLETHRKYYPRSRKFPEIHAISPKRVADFWVPSTNISREPPSNLLAYNFKMEEPQLHIVERICGKVEKQHKVDVVRSWFLSDSEVDLEFSGDHTSSVANAFRTENSKPSVARGLAGGKLDDLADCLLQAVAYVKWEENKQTIREMLLDYMNP